MTREENDVLLPDALRDALGQVLAEKRRQWRRELELIQAEALAVVAELRATIAELAGEIHQKSMEVKSLLDLQDSRDRRARLASCRPRRCSSQTMSITKANVVAHNGSTYQALRDTGHGVTHLDWICLARDGRDGSTPTVRGSHDAHESYAPLDIVGYDGAAFIARHANPGILGHGTGWEMISARGKQGRRGGSITGPRGEKGDKGERGEPGRTIASWKTMVSAIASFHSMKTGSLGRR